MQQIVYLRNRDSYARKDKMTGKRHTACLYEISEHATKTGHLPIWDKVKFIDCDPHWHTQRVHIHTRLHPNYVNRESGIEIPEAWKPTIKKHNSQSVSMQTYEGTASQSGINNEDRNALIAANQGATNSGTQ